VKASKQIGLSFAVVVIVPEIMMIRHANKATLRGARSQTYRPISDCTGFRCLIESLTAVFTAGRAEHHK